MLFSAGNGSKTLAVAIALAEQVQKIGKASDRRYFGIGMSGSGVMVQRLHRTAGEMVYAIGHDYPADDILKAVQQLDAELQGTTTMGVLSGSELKPYLQQIDTLYELLDKEKP